jgi:type I restriction enzyme S subunit
MNNFISASDYCVKVFDGTHDTPKPSDFGYPLLTSKNIVGGRLDLKDAYLISQSDYDSVQKRSAVKQWDILFSMIGSIGEIYLEDNEDVRYAIKNVGVFSCEDESKAKWLYYYLKSPYARKFIGNYLAGAVQKFLGLGTLRDFPVLPYENSKELFVETLSNIDKKITLNNKINTELEQMAKTLYDYWFVQFDFPDVNGKPYKSSGGAMVYNDELKQKIPKNWSSISIESLLATSKNGDWGEDAPDRNLMQVYCVRGADINALNGQSSTLEPPVRYIRKDHNERLLKPDDLIVEISGGSPTQSTGRIAHMGEKVFNRFETPLVCSNFCKAISLKEQTHSYIVKQYWNKLYEAGIFFNFEGKTSGIKNLMFDRLIQDVHLAIPSDKKIIEEFYRMSIKNDELIQNNLLQNKKLAELRDWLLPMLMNGQVTVK